MRRLAIAPVTPNFPGPMYYSSGVMTYYGCGLCRSRGVHLYYVPGSFAPPYPPTFVP
jgi:hypothetical protein